jgi:hypothetical protein
MTKSEQTRPARCEERASGVRCCLGEGHVGPCDPRSKRFSEPQRRFLTRCLESERVGPFLYPAGNRRAALASSAWWRTFDSLRKLGLVERRGDSAVLTDKGRAAFRAVPGLR